ERAIEIAVRLALGQRRQQQGGRGAERRQPVGVVEKARGVRRDELALDGAQMLRQTCTPARGDAVSGLQYRAPARRLPAAHKPGMTAVLARQQLDDQRALAVPPRTQHKPLVTPFHDQSVVPWAFSPRTCSVAKAGTHLSTARSAEPWIPAFAGMT